MTDEKKLKTELSTDNTTASSDITTKWTAPKEAALNEWLNREKFSYDVNDDALYNQYADKFKLGGRMAMMDTMGQAQTMTGGYGNSYAQSVGQQTYQGYMQQLNDVIPELYSLAYGMYTDEGDLLLNKYNALAELDQQEYSKAIDKRNYDYQIGRDAVEDERWKTQNDQAERANLLTEAQIAASLGDYSKYKALGYDVSNAEKGVDIVDYDDLTTSDIDSLYELSASVIPHEKYTSNVPEYDRIITMLKTYEKQGANPKVIEMLCAALIPEAYLKYLEKTDFPGTVDTTVGVGAAGGGTVDKEIRPTLRFD